jgi:hypothetical protein
MKIGRLIFLFCFASIHAFSQLNYKALFKLNTAVDTTYFNTGWSNIDYSVPQSPAFSILGTNPSNIIQPTSAKSIAMGVGNYLLTNGSVIPKNFAVEISPLLLNDHLSLNTYQKCPFLYRWSISLGTATNSSGSYNLAEGIRITIIDKTDLRADNALLTQFQKYVRTSASATDSAITIYRKAKSVTEVYVRGQLDSDTNMHKSIDSVAAVLLSKDGYAQNFIVQTRNKYKQNNWNKTIVQIGAAALQSSTDSMIQTIKGTTKYNFWGTAGLPLGKNGQALIGVKYEKQDSNMVWIDNGSAALRVYYGENGLKAYVQGQLNWVNTVPSQTYSLGCEYNMSNGLWVAFAINAVTDPKGNFTVKPSFNINFGSMEKKKN